MSSMSCVSLITADIDQAFEACSASSGVASVETQSLSLMSPGSRRVPSWFAGVVVRWFKLGRS